MSNFGVYFTLGRQHIADIKGLDHILFIMALCCRYTIQDWKKLLVLVTAFTIGHSLTLLLSVLNLIHIRSQWIELLIPVTIIITCISNLFVKKFAFKISYPLIYFFALFFGLIHGLGFSYYLKSLLGRDQSIIVKLLAFNVGIEAGQLTIVALVLFITFICIHLIKVNRREYLLFLSAAILGIASYLTAINLYKL